MQKLTKRSGSTIRALLLTLYVVSFVGLVFPGATEPLVALAVLAATLPPLWFGPLSLVGDNRRQWCEPTVLFNTGVFLYTLKGATLASGDHAGLLRNMPAQEIEQYVLYSAIIMLVAMLCFNWSYRIFEGTGSVWGRGDGSRKIGALPLNLEPMGERRTRALLLAGVVIPTVFAITCFVMFFVSIGQDVLIFLRMPALRTNLTDGTYGIRAPLANVWRYGSYVMAIASIVWMVLHTSEHRKVHLPLWLHLAGSAAIYVLIGGRAQLGGFIITAAVVYHYLVKPLRLRVFVGMAVVMILWFYFIHVARFIGGTTGGDVLQALTAETLSLFTPENIFEFAKGGDLADFRLFPIIIYAYTHSVPLALGNTFIGFFYGFVPRFLWPSKGSELGVHIGALVTGTVTKSGTPAGFFPQMFMNFHFPGVLLGALTLGGFMGYFYRKWMLEQKSVPDFLKLIVLTPAILSFPFFTFENVLWVVALATVELRCFLLLSRFFESQPIPLLSNLRVGSQSG